VGIVTHGGRVYAAFGSSVQGHNVTAYTRNEGGLALTRWDGRVMLACRSEVVREYHEGSLALMFRLKSGRFVIGYALGEEGMLFRGELLKGDEVSARREALALADFWAGIDTEDDADPWHGEPDEPDDGEIFSR
jgi:hypothetical protein